MISRTIVYPGTFDPIHNGHIDLIKRISQQYDRVVVAVAKDTGRKAPCLNFQERVSLTSAVIEELQLNNVEIHGFEGTTASFARKLGTTAILRGIRDEKDIQSESIFTNVTRSPLISGFFEPPLEVICLMTHPNYKELSSTKIRDMASKKFDVSHLVPSRVADKFKNIAIKNPVAINSWSVDWYKTTNEVLMFWNRNRKSLAVAACSFVAGSAFVYRYLNKM